MTEKDDIKKRAEGLLMLGINVMLRSLNKENLARVAAKFMENSTELCAMLSLFVELVEPSSPKNKLHIKMAKALLEKQRTIFDELIKEGHDQRN